MEEKNKTLSIILEANQSSSNLENGMYTYTSSQNIGDDKSMLHGKGIFVYLPDQLIWSTQTVLGQFDNVERTLIENVQKSGKLYHRSGIVNEKSDYLEENGVPNWEIVAEESFLLPLYLDELLETNVSAADIESIKVSNEGDYKVYELIYTEDYRDSVMKENSHELEEALKHQTTGNTDDFYVNSIKTAIMEQENKEYTDKKVLMKIDKENKLIYKLTQDSFDIINNDSVYSSTATTEIIIDNYNDSSIGIDIDI